MRVVFSFGCKTCSPKCPLLNPCCGNRLNSKFYFQGPRDPVPPRNFARVIEMPVTPGHEGPSSHFNDNESFDLHHSDGPQTVNEIGLGGFPFYQDGNLEKYNVCLYLALIFPSQRLTRRRLVVPIPLLWLLAFTGASHGQCNGFKGGVSD